MRERKFLILVVLASLAIELPLSLFFVNGFTVDESLYLSLARSFEQTFRYGISTVFNNENFVAPLWPITMSMFYKFGGETGVEILSAVISSLIVVVFYFLGKKLYNKKIGEYAALFALFNPAIILLGTRVLTETLEILLFTLSILFLFLSVKKKYNLVLFFIFSALAVMEHYPLFLQLPVVFVVFLIFTKKFELLKSRYFFIGILAGLLVLSPWLIYNAQNYGSILGSPLHQASTDAGFNLSQAVMYIPDLFVILGPLFPFVFLGMKFVIDKKQFVLPALFVSFFLAQFFVLGKVAVDRYLVPVLPYAAIFSGIALEKLFHSKWKKVAKYAFTILLAVGLVIGVYSTISYGSSPRYVDTKQAVLWMKENCNSPVISNGFTYVWYYSGFENLPLLNETQTYQLAKGNNVTCIMFSRYEPYVADFFQNSTQFTLLKSFGMVSVYRLNG